MTEELLPFLEQHARRIEGGLARKTPCECQGYDRGINFGLLTASNTTREKINNTPTIWVVDTTKGDGYNCETFWYNEYGAQERKKTLIKQHNYEENEVRIRRFIEQEVFEK